MRRIVIVFLLSCVAFSLTAQDETPLRIWVPRIGELELLEQALEEAVPIPYQVESVAATDYIGRMLEAIEIRGGPDLALVPSEVVSGPLASYAEPIPETREAEIGRIRQGYRRDDGQLAAISVGVAPVVAFFNPEVMEEIGLEIPRRVDWHDLAELSRSVAEADRRVVFQRSPYVGASIVASMDTEGNLFRTEYGAWDGVLEENAELSDLLFNLPNVYTAYPDEIIDPFIETETAIVVGEYWMLQFLGEAEVATLPASVGSSYGWVILGQRDQALRVVNSLNSNESFAQYVMSTGYLPTARRAIAALNQPNARQVVSNAQVWRVPSRVDTGMIYRAYEELIEDLFEEKVTLDDALDTLVNNVLAAERGGSQ